MMVEYICEQSGKKFTTMQFAPRTVILCPDCMEASE